MIPPQEVVEDTFESDSVFTLPDSDSDKVSDSDNITVNFYEAHIRIGSRIGIEIGQCAHSLNELRKSHFSVLMILPLEVLDTF